MTVALIWAQANGGVIGQDNTIPWHVPEDSRRFRELTTGHPVVMGRKTWDSLPDRFRPLPGRTNIVVTTDRTWHADGALAVNDLDAAFQNAASADGGEVTVVMGGGQIYSAAMPFATHLYVTEIALDIAEGDAVAPEIDTSAWELAVEGDWMTSQKGPLYRFRDYRRIGA